MNECDRESARAHLVHAFHSRFLLLFKQFNGFCVMLEERTSRCRKLYKCHAYIKRNYATFLFHCKQSGCECGVKERKSNACLIFFMKNIVIVIRNNTQMCWREGKLYTNNNNNNYNKKRRKKKAKRVLQRWWRQQQRQRQQQSHCIAFNSEGTSSYVLLV